jgi:hypothetical protein
MKTSIITICFMMLSALMGAQRGHSETNQALQKENLMVYSEEEDAMIHKDQMARDSKDIIIQSLPGYGEGPVPVYVNDNIKGTYTLKKHPTLYLPEFYSVVIEDTLTGRKFDLKTSDSFSFDVTGPVSDRFVLYITKSKTTLTAMK